MRISILGAGAWGTALAVALAKQHQVVLYTHRADHALAMIHAQENAPYLPAIVLPSDLTISADLTAAATHAALVIVATPVAALREICQALAAFSLPNVVWLCKGFEESSGKLPHQIVNQVLPGVAAGVISGPSFAQEVARGLPVALTVATTDSALTELIVQALHHGVMRAYRSDDLIGVEIGGAVKNILAIATGIADGLELGLNARAALMTRGLAEMMRLGIALGAQPDTLMGLTGVGDLILTCTGGLSRNRRVGLGLAQGKPLAQILAELGHIAEGVRCARIVRDLARAHGVDMPITTAACEIMFDGIAPCTVVAKLLARSSVAES